MFVQYARWISASEVSHQVGEILPNDLGFLAGFPFKRNIPVSLIVIESVSPQLEVSTNILGLEVCGPKLCILLAVSYLVTDVG